MANIAIFRINYKSDFILTLNSDAGWLTPFCIKFWTGAPSRAYFVGFDGITYTHCAPVDGEPTKLRVQFDDHRLPIGDLKFQISYHFTVADFPTSVEDEVLNQASVIIEVDDVPAQVMLDLNGETAPEIEFSLPAYANEAQRIANEQARIAAEQQRIANEDARIQAEETRQYNEQQRIQHEEERVSEFARLKSESEAATTAANAAATLANEKAQLAADKAALADAAATLANEKAQLAADKSALAQAAATLANEKAALAQQKAEYAQTQGDYAKAQGDYAKAQGDTAQADHVRAEADHTTAADDHSRAEGDHTTAASDHSRAESDHTTAASDHSLAESDHTTAASDHSRAESDHTTSASDHTRAEADHTTAASDHETAASDHTRAESDHAAVEVYVDSLGAFDISSYHATGGELAKYADLTAALGTDGANIPEGIRKGGMSVKFVHTYDNKYIQARCMAQNFTTDVTQWQGVDDEPTTNSDNLVRSGGVKSYLNQQFIIGDNNNAKFVDIQGILPNKTYAINIDKDNISHSNVTPANVNAFGIYSADGSGNLTSLRQIQTNNYQGIPYIIYITTPSSCKYLHIVCRADANTKVRFSIEPVNNEQEPYAYFDNAAFPQFSKIGNILRVVLPAEVLNIVHRPSKVIDISSLTEEERTFTINSPYYLVYNYHTEALSVINYKTFIENDCDVLLGNLGGQNTGYVPGLLNGYYYTWLKNNNDANITILRDDIDSVIKTDHYSSSIYNGTPNNHSNANCVRTSLIPIGEFIPCEVFTDRPVSAEGNYYIYAVMLKDSNGDTILNKSNTLPENKTFTTIEGTATVEIGIGEKDSEGTIIPIRITDFINYSIYIRTTSVRESIKNLDDKITENFIAYFTGPSYPEFRVTGNNSLKVTLPSLNSLKLYDIKGRKTITVNLSELPEREFTLGSINKIVYDLDNNTIIKTAVDAVGNYVNLLSASGNSTTNGQIDGLLVGYYYTWLKNELNGKIGTIENDIDTIESKLVPDVAINNLQKWADLKLLFFSDVHASWTNVQRIVDYANNLGASLCDCIINGGDTVKDYMTDGLSSYNSIIDSCTIPVLTTPGNHDCWNGSGWVWGDKKDVYNLVTAKVASSVPTIVQPSNAATDGLNYYYKDFDNIRVISILSMSHSVEPSTDIYYDSSQDTWLAGVLESARTTYHYWKIVNGVPTSYSLQSGDTVTATLVSDADLNNPNNGPFNNGNIYAVPMGVIIFTHAPYYKPDADRVDSNKINSWMDYRKNVLSHGIRFDSLHLSVDAVSTVADYITNGGCFICWLTGHTHADNVLTHKTYDGQFMLNITSARYNYKPDGYVASSVNEPDFDCFDYIGVDALSGQIKVLRVGWAQDSAMRVRRSWCYDYINKELLSEN